MFLRKKTAERQKMEAVKAASTAAAAEARAQLLKQLGWVHETFPREAWEMFDWLQTEAHGLRHGDEVYSRGKNIIAVSADGNLSLLEGKIVCVDIGDINELSEAAVAASISYGEGPDYQAKIDGTYECRQIRFPIVRRYIVSPVEPAVRITTRKWWSPNGWGEDSYILKI